MHPYIVYVRDSQNNKDSLSIPCAEIKTAELVQKNLESLFPDSKIYIKEEIKKSLSKPVSNSESLVVDSSVTFLNLKSKKSEDYVGTNSDEFSVLEQNLFEDVA